MTKAQLQRYKKQLLELQGRLREEIGLLIQAIAEEERAPGEHERRNVPTEETAKECHVEQTEEEIHRAIAAALERIEQGTFGRCQRCGGWIGRERLDALPYAAYCIDCETRLEQSAAS